MLGVLAGLGAMSAAQAGGWPADAALLQGEGTAATVDIGTATDRDVQAANGRRYRIRLYQPPGVPPASGWPVLYVLDGNAMFLTAVETVQGLARRPDAPPGTQAVVVGIGYPAGTNVRVERNVDLGPFTARNPMSGQPMGGGGEAFADFITAELKPAIARQVPIDGKRQAIFGHSLGGLLVMHLLATRGDQFDTWLAASPSLWYGDGRVIDELAAMARARGTGAVAPARVLMTYGEHERSQAPWAPAPGGDLAAANATLARLAQIDNGQKAAGLLREAPGIAVELEVIPGEDHQSVVPAAIGRAIRHWLMPAPAD